MILVDTSVWIDHFRKGSSLLAEFLSEASVLIHPFVIGELACGNLKNRTRILGDLQALPSAVSAAHEEVLGGIRREGGARGLHGIRRRLRRATVGEEGEVRVLETDNLLAS